MKVASMENIPDLTPLEQCLAYLRKHAKTKREQGTYFEELVIAYLKNEPQYATRYSDVWTYKEWAEKQGQPCNDNGIDLVAQEKRTGEFHAIQCKFYESSAQITRADLDKFMSASGQKPFTNRIFICTSNHWTKNAEAILNSQSVPIYRIGRADLEASVIDWEKYVPGRAPVIKEKKKLLYYQEEACAKVLKGLINEDRGKLIMACGTGKTFTSLKIAEAQAGKGKRVLFLVPSLALLNQALTEWTQQSEVTLHSFAVCSDSTVGKRRDKKDDDSVNLILHDVQHPATTDAVTLAQRMNSLHVKEAMSVVFCTYHSIDVIAAAQKNHGLPAFDLAICDEAHRTTGQTESAFVRIHDNNYINVVKRLYMTATPRIYDDNAKNKASAGEVVIYSMDDESIYGKNLYILSFSEAVERGLLVDYKVIILTVEESQINRRLQNLLKDEDNSLRVDDAAKIIGCWKALSRQDLAEGVENDAGTMKRAVAFCNVIDRGQSNKVGSLQIADMFQKVVEEYQRTSTDKKESSVKLRCEVRHVDGTMNSSEKEERIQWLKRTPSEENICHILSNVRCLSEGVDVPALDAVLFLAPKKSQVEVVQAVGRVMRKAPGKKRGYIVLPVVIPSGVTASDALNDNKAFQVVWQVAQALRSHDDKFEAMINKLDLTGGFDLQKMEVVMVMDLKPTRNQIMNDASGLASSTNFLGQEAAPPLFITQSTNP